MNSSYSKYFEDCEVKPEFEKEFVSLWSDWLGKENLHILDEVTKEEWSLFNDLIRLISDKFKIEILDCGTEFISDVSDIETTLSTHEDSLKKTAADLSKYILPELECVFSEDWDYTYIIWHKNNGAIEALTPFIDKAGLKHFSD